MITTKFFTAEQAKKLNYISPTNPEKLIVPKNRREPLELSGHLSDLKKCIEDLLETFGDPFYEIDYSYENETILGLSVYAEETDFELASRKKREAREAADKAQEALDKEEHEKKEYLRLKAKYDGIS